MQAAPARRFHEAGLGSRTGLRIGSVRLDEQGQEDLDAFFAESKRVLEWMEGSEDDAEAPSEAGSEAWHRQAPQMAAESLEARPSLAPRADETLWNSTVDISRAERTFRLASSSPVPMDAALPSTSTPVVVPRGRGSESRASLMDVSLPGTDASWARPAASRASLMDVSLPGTDASWARPATSLAEASFLRPEASRLPETDVSFLRPEASRLSVSEASFVRSEASRLPETDVSFLRPEASHLSVSEASFLRPEASRLPETEVSFARPDASRLPETEVSFLRPEASRLSVSDVSFLRPEASRLAVGEASFLRPDASELARPTWDDAASASDPPSEPMEALDAIDEEEPEPVPIKRGRGRPRKDPSMPPLRGRPGRPPGRQRPAQRVVERILDPPAWQLENPEGLRRGKRHRIAPLDWWRGERALYGKPDEPTGDALTGVVAPVLKQVIRVPRAPGEGTFSGMRRFRAKPAGYAQPGRPPGSRNYVPRLSPVEEDEDDEEAAEAWEADTDPYGRVMDADTNTEVTMRIACTAAGIRPRPAFNQAFSYEKIFGISDFMAAGVLVIPEGGEKPAKPSKDNNYTFVVLRGVVQVMVHRTRFVIASGGMFLVPKGNTYHIRNVSQREVRLFFAQARLLTDAPHMTHVVREGRTAFAHGPERVRVEEEEDEAEDEDDAASDADASGDYIDPT
ncbi:mitotic fidelity of chromosome transmission- protein [Malassezia arunalokei]|uniref:CENP-C homolog n=1 Tax=Malassezia arunalokei TaxID=1514897 RepID=A0AAJ5Z6D8_9BASI|nr:mitotic fidelity of chromosome transmission- protein [Malassezia arunalokei]